MQSLFTSVVVTVLLAGSASAQNGIVSQQRPKQRILKQQKQNQNSKMVPLPAPAVERFLQMSPEEQERALSKLTPERRQEVEQRLDRLQQLPPEQLQRLQDLYPAFMSLRPARRQAVRAEIKALRQLRPAERKDLLNSDGGNFSLEELSILRQVAGIPE